MSTGLLQRCLWLAGSLLCLLVISKQGSCQSPEEELVFLLPGFSVQSGVKVGEVFDPEPPPPPPPPPPAAENATEDELSAREAEITKIAVEYEQTLQEHAKGPPVIYSSPDPGNNNSEFSLCLRIKPHYKRPEFVLFSSYSINLTSVVIGVDERQEKIYFKYAKSADSAELTRVSFDWLPRLDVWEHVCFVKKSLKDKPGVSQLKLFVNGVNKGQESNVTAQLNDLTLLVLGQTDPPSLATSFSGEISHFALWDRPLLRKETKRLAECGDEYYNLVREASAAVAWEEGVWHAMVSADSNDTTVDPLAAPTGMYYDWREVCRQIDDKKDKLYLMPIYRKKSKDYHEELCTQLGGTIPDLVNFGQEATEKRVQFVSDVFLSARIPRVLEPQKPPEPDKEEPSDLAGLLEEALLEEAKETHKTPLNMQSCFVNDEFVVWLDNTDEAPKPPEARGAKGVKAPLPIDPHTGKPFGFFPPGFNVQLGPGGGGGGKKDEKECPHHVLYNGTAVSKCGNDPTACSVCLLRRRRPTLRARGLCEKSWLKGHRGENDGGTGQEEFDTAFFPKTDKLTGETVFRGPLGSRIFKNVNAEEEENVIDRNGDWILESLVSPWRADSQAIVSKIPATKLPVGRHTWEMVTDVCETDSKEIALTACKKDEFTCKTGTCIPLTYRCDIYHDCDDGEDEEGCESLQLDDDYQSQVAPRHVKKGIPWPVYVGIEIVSFPKIEAIEQLLAVDFYLTLRWYDPRLQYQNLRKGKFDNPLGPETTQALWVPRLGLLNGLSEFQTIVTEEDAEFYRGYVWRRGEPKKSGLRPQFEVFDGSKNPLILLREFYQEFTCHFDLLWYPFDRQKCFMNFTVQGQTAKGIILRPDNKIINYLGHEYLVEYRVMDQELIIPKVASGNFSTATVELTFQRRVVYHLLNIFLQSFFLVLTGYMSLFFSVNNFSDRVMVALTVMLVMASLQSSVQDSLPKTAYFKFIDWWILFSLNTQIWIMAFHTFQGIYANKEYLAYKEAMSLRTSGGGKGNGGSTLSLEPAGSKNAIMTGSTTSSILEDEILSSEEFDYPKTAKLNKWFNIFFLFLLTAFNVVYWSIAMGVYFS